MTDITFNDHPAAREYVRRFIGTVLGYDPPPESIDPIIAEKCFYELGRFEEIDQTWRDQWGNWDWPFAKAHRRGELYLPRLDKSLAEFNRQPSLDQNLSPLWPDGKSFALCLTHDIDEINNPKSLRTGLRRAGLIKRSGCGTTAALKAGIRALIDALTDKNRKQPDKRRTIDDWLELEDQHGFKSTFFVFPETTSKACKWDCIYRFDDKIAFKANILTFADAVREIDRLGWEIGLHGSYHSALIPGLLAGEKRQLERILNKDIISSRQHYLHYDPKVTPVLQSEAGLKIDSTIGFNRSIGFRSGTSFPYRCWDHNGQKPLPMLEIPQIIMDASLFLANSLEYNRELAVTHCLEIMETVKKFGGCLTLNWHHDHIDDDLYWDTYSALLSEGARRGAWGCSTAMLHKWWTDRENNIFGKTP